MTEQKQEKLETQPIATKEGAGLVAGTRGQATGLTRKPLKDKSNGNVLPQVNSGVLLHNFPGVLLQDDNYAGCCYEE